MNQSIALRIALAISDIKRREKLRGVFTHYAIETNCDIDISHIGKNFDVLLKNMPNYDIVIMDEEVLIQNKKNLHELYWNNPECSTILFGMNISKINLFLDVHPCAYMNCAEGSLQLQKAFYLQLDHLLTSDKVLQIKTREGTYAVTIKEILYCQSDLKYIIISTTSGGQFRKLGKLDDIIKILPSDFRRVHQSYIVNTKLVSIIDKKAHEIELFNKIRIPYSRIYAQSVNDLFQN